MIKIAEISFHSSCLVTQDMSSSIMVIDHHIRSGTDLHLDCQVNLLEASIHVVPNHHPKIKDGGQAVVIIVSVKCT